MKLRNRAPTASTFVLLSIIALVACKDEAVRKAARASDDMAVTIGLAIDAKRELAASGLLKPEEELPLTLGLQKVNTTVRAFHAQVKAASQLDPATKNQLLLSLSSVTSAVAELNQQGVLGIKNEQAKTKISTILAGFNAAFVAINAALGGA